MRGTLSEICLLAPSDCDDVARRKNGAFRRPSIFEMVLPQLATQISYVKRQSPHTIYWAWLTNSKSKKQTKNNCLLRRVLRWSNTYRKFHVPNVSGSFSQNVKHFCNWSMALIILSCDHFFLIYCRDNMRLHVHKKKYFGLILDFIRLEHIEYIMPPMGNYGN